MAFSNVLVQIMEANKEYIIWINSEKFKNFKDKAGNSELPFKVHIQNKVVTKQGLIDRCYSVGASGRAHGVGRAL